MNGGIDRRRLIVLGTAGALAAALPGRAATRAAARLQPGERITDNHFPAPEASWYKKLDEGRVECHLCPRKCRVANAERGFCGARENRKGTYHTLVWGASCAVHVDPIEKKPFFHVLPGEKALSYATAGCNVECKFCQNWEISQFRPEQVSSYWLPPDAMVKLAGQYGAKLTAATYSEPVIFWEYVRDVARASRKAGLRPTVVSNGYIQEKPLRDVLPMLTAYKVDLKSFSERFYKKLIRGELKPVLDTLVRARKIGTWLEIVVLIIPTWNDSDQEARGLSRWVVKNLGPDVPVHFTRFHPTYRLTDLPPTPVPTIERLWKIGKAEGLHFAYVGNVPGHPGESTYCPGCGALLIRRLGFQILANRLENGHCPDCGRKIPGVWK
ncbi:MAG: AmmeMemoRadiSam system radical SAM enzyme [Acidobacteria bacterium]|nr:AmmeMemoRadiSam system radical SAM enzyme [Acidobacteriota bacterium]